MIFAPTFDQLRAEIVQNLEQRMQFELGWWQLSELRENTHRTPPNMIEYVMEAVARMLHLHLQNLAFSITAELDLRLGTGKPLEALSNEEIEHRCTTMMSLLAAREAAERRGG